MEEKTLEERRKQFAEKFRLCQPALSAVGDETRQQIETGGRAVERCGENDGFMPEKGKREENR